MGTHPIFESDFDCLTDKMLRGGLRKQLAQIRKQSVGAAAAVGVKAESFVNGTNAAYVEDMYLSWMEDPKSVHASWASYFKQVPAGAAPGAGVSNAEVERQVKQNLALENMI